jgi:hypothetical protein
VKGTRGISHLSNRHVMADKGLLSLQLMKNLLSKILTLGD